MRTRDVGSQHTAATPRRQHRRGIHHTAQEGMARILVVEDDRSLREMLRISLSARDHSVICVADAIEAIKALLGEPFDLVLTDITMPYLNGMELLRAIRGDPKTSHIPVVLLTGKSDDDTWAEATRAGAAGYLTKPARGEDLIDVIDKALSGNRRRPGFRPAAAGGGHRRG
jgi:CheY-like chemotaxis protein